jgi:hypothetical protein
LTSTLTTTLTTTLTLTAAPALACAALSLASAEKIADLRDQTFVLVGILFVLLRLFAVAAARSQT